MAEATLGTVYLPSTESAATMIGRSLWGSSICHTMGLENRIPVENLPQSQALDSATFRPPPLDGSLEAAELYDWHRSNNTEHTLFVYSQQDGNIRTIRWPEAVDAIHVGAKFVRKVTNWVPGMTETPVVGMVVASDSISYWTMFSAIYRAGCVAFPISPRNSPSAVAHLITSVNVTHLFVGREPAMGALTNAALDLISAPEERPRLVQMPLFEELYGQPPVDPQDVVYEKRGLDSRIAYLHSSGSTSFPKPIPFSSRRFIEIACAFYFGSRDVTGMVLSMHTVPMFHALGFILMSCVTSTGMITSMFEPRFPAQPPTPQAHFDASVATECDVVVSVPSVIEAWSSNSEYVEWLATRTGVMFAGGALSKSAGDYLVSKGVRTMNLYGTTETGGISKVVPDDDTEWEYFRLSEAVVPELDPQGDGTYELILMPGPVSNLILSNTTVRGIPAYATSDLLIPHPTKPHLYKIYGRKDDQIIHSTGEKTNPTPLEAILNHDMRIKSAVLFGTGRFQVGVLIDPEPGLLPAGDERALEEFKSAIWPSIQKMNEYAPQHSRIFKEMIILSKPSKPFTYTAKGTARRQAVIRDYQEEIDELYEATGSSSQLSVEVELPVVWSYGNTLEFVREVVNSTLTKTVGDQDDIFHHGCDSLQATNIRNVLLRGLRDGAKVETLSLGKGNFVYTAPTISSLADLMMRTIDHKPLPPSVNSSLSSRVEKMMQMADHYSHFSPSEFVAALPLHLTQPRGKTAGRVVLLTGTTGALGSYILELLLKDKSVGRVYALNRRRRSSSATTILDRQKKVFQEKGLDVAILDAASDRLELLEGELSRPDFGLSKDVLGEVVSSVTTIIHNAWPVDFKFSLKSFEPMIKGLGNLISFSLASPLRPTVLFASTFAVLQNATPSPTPYQEVEIPPEYAVGTGYTESKWVAEELLCRASRDMGLRSLIVRVGQIAGGNNGTWKPEEWFPSLVMSSPDVGSFPDCDKLIGWIPLSTAAKAFTDFSRHPISGHRIAHLVHPRPITWNKVASTIARELGIPLSPFEDWLTTVRTLSESSSSKLEDNKLKHLPVLKLLTFMETSIAASLAEPNCDAMGIPFVDVSNALEFSSTLRDPKLASLDASDVRAWLRYWQNASKMPLTTARTQHGSHRRLFTSLWSSVLHFCTMLIGFSR